MLFCLWWACSTQPPAQIFAYECVVMEVRVGGDHTIDFFGLTAGKDFVWIEAPCSGQQALATKHFVDSRDATSKTVGRIEESRIAIRDLDVAAEQFRRNVATAIQYGMNFIEQFNGRSSPHAPVPEQTAANSDPFLTVVRDDVIGSQQVRDDVVIVAGVKSDCIVAVGVANRTNHIQSLVAVEGSQFDCDDVLNLSELPPEFIRQHTTTDGRLQVEANHRHDLGNFSAMRN
ncbi:hypothetical protein-signal peptide and transmembrane prediction [Rhodopirellula baltica SH 1]|uniref:Uncharacterized protein n=1 Tax=Rhodopirellula baltica (strain DSM 10527 / NCIMB 13988 / SH1) TaxID=243090 RepID=Q7UGB5_RHOBA|nr:hypothetical protein-signal peptide and transmembrane prediction [Rhodopirellula baltica SH 1]